MSRKKKDTSEEVTEKIDLNALRNSINQDEEEETALEAEAIAKDEEFPSEEPTEKLDLAELEEKAEKKPRKPRKKKAKAEKPTVEKIEEPEIEALKEAVAEEAEEPQEEAPKKRRKKSETKADVEEIPAPIELEMPIPLKQEAKDPSPSKVTLRRDASMASVAMQQSMDAMVKNWNSMKDATQAVSTNFEHVAQMMNSLTGSYEESMKHVAKIQASLKSKKPSALSKAAMAVSAAAIIISLISLSFTQALRQSALNPKNVDSAKAATRMTELPTKALAIQPEPKAESVAPENKVSEKNPPIKIKKTTFRPPQRSKR